MAAADRCHDSATTRGCEGFPGVSGIRRAPPLPVRAAAQRILIVDDDLDILEAERQILSDHGYRVVVARDGREAQWAIEAGPPPAVIVLDIQMPGLDGPAFARELRLQLRHVPLVVLTAAGDPRREADRCNAEAYLSKPFDAHTLVELVDRFAA